MNTEKLRTEALGLALDKLLNRSASFSICSIDALGKSLGTNPDLHPDYKFLRTLHCVDYSSMSSELRAQLPKTIMAVLSQRYDTDLMAKALSAVMGGEIKSLPPTEDDNPTRTIRLARG